MTTQEVTPDVQVAPSTTETAVTETAETTATETTATQETTEQVQGTPEPTATEQKTVQINADLYDERGVPWKNVAMEHQRKLAEFNDTLPKRIAEEVAKSTTTKKQYTIAELEQFAQANPEHRAWAEQEKAAVLKAELSQEWEQKLQATQKAQQAEIVRRDTFNYVLNQFPEIAVRDQQGNFISWNNMSPMTQAMGKYMSNPDLANRPDGLLVAAKLAFADTAMSKMPTTQKTIQSLKSQVRKAQAATMLEGGGRKPAAENPNRKLLERVKASGKLEDAASVMGNILRAQGQMKG